MRIRSERGNDDFIAKLSAEPHHRDNTARAHHAAAFRHRNFSVKFLGGFNQARRGSSMKAMGQWQQDTNVGRLR